MATIYEITNNQLTAEELRQTLESIRDNMVDAYVGIDDEETSRIKFGTAYGELRILTEAFRMVE